MTGSRGFNLVDDAWIPIGGREVPLSKALMDAHELPGWPDGEPGLAAVLLRLMAVIAYRVTGLDDENLDRAQFAERQQRLLSEGRLDGERVHAYLAQHHDRFWLVNPPAGLVPFAQDPSLEATDPHPVAKVVSSWASGDNPALGPHCECAAIPPAVAARQLLLQRAYAICGTSTPHPSTGRPRGYVQNGALRGTISLHPVGSNLAATLVGHLVPPPADGTGFGRPFWEAPPPASPVAAHRGIPGFLEQVAGRQDKTMLLRTGTDANVIGFTIAEGPGIDSNLRWRDPYLLVDAEREPLKPRAGRAFWREAESLLAQDDQGRRKLSAQVLDWAGGEYGGSLYAPRMYSWAAISHNGDKSKELEWRSSTSPDLISLFDPGTALRVRGFLALASEAEEKMVKQVAKAKHAADLMPPRSQDRAAVYAPARAEFWRRAEQDFWATAAGRLQIETYTNRLRSHALAGYDTATATLLHDRRTHRFVVESRRWVAAWRRQPSEDTAAPEE